MDKMLIKTPETNNNVRDFREVALNAESETRGRILYVISVIGCMAVGFINVFSTFRLLAGTEGLSAPVIILASAGITVGVCYFAPHQAGLLLGRNQTQKNTALLIGACALSAIAIWCLVYLTIARLHIDAEMPGLGILGDGDQEWDIFSFGAILTILMTSAMLIGFVIELTRTYVLYTKKEETHVK